MIWVWRVWRIFLGLIFLSAGWSKTGESLALLADIYAYQIPLPDLLAEILSLALPWIEITLGAALIFGVFPRLATIAALGLLAIYTLLTAQAWWRGLPIECGCMDFSGVHPALAILSSPLGATLRNLLLLLATVSLGFPWKSEAKNSPAT
jgi:uncharacterized membrane protein YphA (DoxX/SURF4 family)